MTDDHDYGYIIRIKECPKCGGEFDWIFGVCPTCYPNGYLDAIKEITDKLTK